MGCKHKFIHLKTESWYDAYRYSNTFFLIDYFFCEKCLEEKNIRKEESIGIYKETPEWAIGITHKRKSE